MYYRKPSQAAICAQERRRREDGAPRVLALFTDLTALKITVEENGGASNPKYIRRIVLANAPALFLIPCGEAHCSDGGHDITHEVTAALRARMRNAKGTHECNGSIGSTPCRRSITFEVEAEYGSDPKPS